MVNAARHRAVPDTSRAERPDNTKRAEQTTSMRRTLRLIRQDVAPEKKLIGAGVVALLCEVCFRVLEPWPLKIVVDALSVSLGAKVDELSATPALLLTCGVALLAIVGARALSNYLATVAFSLVGSRAATSLRSRVFSHVQRLSPAVPLPQP